MSVMKKILLIAGIGLILPWWCHAQILNPVKWHFYSQKIGAGQYIVHMKATIDQGWHVYAQKAGNGPVPTSFTFHPDSRLQLYGQVREIGKLEQAYDSNFRSNLKFYENQVDFVQYVRAKAGIGAIKGSLEFMVCNNHECLPPRDVPFEVKL